MGYAVPQEQKERARKQAIMEVGEVVDFDSREEGLREAMSYANHEAMRCGEEVVISVCQGAAKCNGGSDPKTCHWCERISCLPSGEIRHYKPGLC